MRITSLRILGARRLPDIDLDLRHERTGTPADVVVVSGPLASGKTALLEAVFAARQRGIPGAPRAPWLPASRDDDPVKVQVGWSLPEPLAQEFPGDDERVLEAIFGAHEGFPAENEVALIHALGDETRVTGRLEYFHAERLRSTLDGAFTRSHRSSASDDKYMGTAAFLAELVLLDLPDRARLDAALAAAGSHKRLAGAQRVGAGFAPTFSGRHGEVGLHALSHGERDVLRVLATMLRFDLTVAPIFIDLPELAVGPSGGAALLGAMRTLAPDAQIVVATHCPEAFRQLDRARFVTLDGGAA